MSTRHPRLRRKLAAAIGVLASMSLLAACATSDATPGAAAGGEPQAGGDITFLIDSLGDTWIPNNGSISSYQGQVWRQVTDKLVYVDEEGAVSPWVAESWEQNEDATEYTLNLRDGVTFSDGTPVDADAVVANLDIWANGDPERGINRIGLFPSANYESATAVDPATVKVTFTQPTLGFIPTLGYHGSILLSPETIALPAEGQADLSNAIGSGAFTVESWQEGDNVVLTKRDDYTWGPEALDHTGPAYLDSITYKIVAEQSLRTASVQSSQADVGYNASPQELEALSSEGFQVATPRYLGFAYGFAVDTRVEPFGETAVRQAFQHGIDRQEILDTVYTDDWQAAESFIQSNVPEATDHSAAFAYDPAESERLLDEAGWVAGADGVRTKDGKRLEVTLHPTPYLATSQPVDELIAQQLTRIGFDVTLEAFDVITYGERVTNKEGIAVEEPTRSFIDIGTVAGVLTSVNGGEDWFGVGESDTTLNDFATGISTASDPEARSQLADELQAYVLEQGYYVPVTQIVQRIYVQQPGLQGVTYDGVAFANYATAWLS